MNRTKPRRRRLAILLASSLVLPLLTAAPGIAADYGRVAGTVTDTQGNPLMGATVLLVGPAWGGSRAEAAVQRVITDARGRFSVERLAPGWYSLRVTSATRLPIQRNGVRVEPGQTSDQKFVLSDIFAPVRFQVPSGNVTSWGDDWKWILRTSASTRPVLRFQEGPKTASSRAETPKAPLPPGQCLVGMSLGSTRREALAGDQGLGSVLAYVRSISVDSDVLVAGSMAASGLQASSLATAVRKNLMKGDPQELALVVHQLNFSDGVPIVSGGGRKDLLRAQGVVVSYSHSRPLSDALSLTAGFEIDYLNAARDALAAQPRMELAYRLNSSTVVVVRHGAGRLESSNTLLDRIGTLNAFPRVTMQDNRFRLEDLYHTEASIRRALGKTARVELAVYRDFFHNAAVWGFGDAGASSWLGGNFLPHAASDGVILNAGNYRSSGFRSVYLQRLGPNVEAAFAYAVGHALVVDPTRVPVEEIQSDFRRALRADRSRAIAGKVSARVPATKTQIVTSYEWLQRGRVTGVDPYGQASLELQPYLGLQIRQPLPTLAFFPAHIEALADFRNLLGQGYVPVSRAGDKPLLLSSAYRSIRGGFSVQF